MGDVFTRSRESIGDALRLLVPGLLLLVLLNKEYLTVVDRLADGTEPLWLWTLLFAWGAGLIIATLHRCAVEFLVEAIVTRFGVTALGEIRQEAPDLSSAAAMGRLMLWRTDVKVVQSSLADQLRRTWSYTHLLWMVGEVLFVVFSIRYLGFDRSMEALVAVVSGLLIIGLAFVRSWHLFGAEAEIWRSSSSGEKASA